MVEVMDFVMVRMMGCLLLLALSLACPKDAVMVRLMD